MKFQQLKTCVNHASTGVKGKCVIQLFKEKKTRILEWPNTILLGNELPICLFFHELIKIENLSTKKDAYFVIPK